MRTPLCFSGYAAAIAVSGSLCLLSGGAALAQSSSGSSAGIPRPPLPTAFTPLPRLGSLPAPRVTPAPAPVMSLPRPTLPSSLPGGGVGASRPALPTQLPSSYNNFPPAQPYYPQTPIESLPTYVIGPGTTFTPFPQQPYCPPQQTVIYSQVNQTVYPGYSQSSTTVVVNGRGRSAGYDCPSPFAIYACAPVLRRSVTLFVPCPLPLVAETGGGIIVGSGNAVDSVRAARLQDALTDIARFWEARDVQALRRRVAPDLSIAIFDGERYLYALRRNDYLSLAADALENTRTVSFRYLRIAPRQDGSLNVYAEHRFRSSETGVVTAIVRLTLVSVDGDWYLAAATLPAAR